MDKLSGSGSPFEIVKFVFFMVDIIVFEGSVADEDRIRIDLDGLRIGGSEDTGATLIRI